MFHPARDGVIARRHFKANKNDTQQRDQFDCENGGGAAAVSLGGAAGYPRRYTKVL